MLKLTFTDLEKQALAYERCHHPHSRVRRKMDVLWLKSQGLAHQDIARLAGVSPKTLRSYFRGYREGGIAGLKVLRFRRPQSELVAHQQPIEAYFRDHPPASINEAIAAIRELTGLTRSPTQVRLFLKNTCGMKRLKTGVLPAKADPAVQATFKKKNSNPVWLKPKRARAACSS
jgi:transposase